MTPFRRALACLVLVFAADEALGTCQVSTTGLSFGSYDVFDPEDLDITGTITVSCDAPRRFEISLSAGLGAYDSRTMTGPSGPFSYNLYLDPQHVTVWGDGSPGTSTISGSGQNATYTVYGRIRAAQNVFMGIYSDTIIVTVSWQ